MPRLHSIDFLKLIIAAGVVWAHATLLSYQGGVLAYVIGHGLVRTVVPTFAVLSGFFFHSTLHHGRARIWLIRLGVFYLVWCVLYLPLWWPSVASPQDLVKELVFGPLHLWYMAALMLALLLIHGIQALSGDEQTGRRRLLSLALVFLFCGTALQSVNFFSGLSLSIHVWRNGIFFEFPFAAIGFLVADRIRRKGRDWIPATGVIWSVLIGLALLRLIEAAIGLNLYGLSVSAPPEFPLLAMAFSAALLLAALRTPMRRVPGNIAFQSMMIYFLHFIVLVVALHLGFRNMWVLMGLGVGLPMLAGWALLVIGAWARGHLPEPWYLRIYGSVGSGGRV